MDPKWFPPVDRPFQSVGPSIALASGVGFSSLLLPNGLLRGTFALPPLLLILYNLRQHTAGKWEENYLAAQLISGFLVKVVDVCILHNAEEDFWRVNTDGERDTVRDGRNMSTWQRFFWKFDLWTTQRGIGWDWQVKNVDKVKSTSRSHFVLEQLLRAGYCYAFLDIRQWYMRHSGLGQAREIFSLPLSQQILSGWLTALQSGFGMVIGYYLAAAIAVGSGLYEPRSWPPLFGSFVADGYTVRNIWGRCWHQLLRRIFENVNNGLLCVLRIRKGSLVSRYLQLYNAFLVSALIHHVGTLNCPYSNFVRYQFYFFMMQPVAITVEDIAIGFGKKVGWKDTWKTRTIGYAWVAGYLSYSLRYTTAAYQEVGLVHARHPMVDQFSIMKHVFR